MEDIKQFLYSWLGKQHKVPSYDVISLNNKNRQRFKCELRVDGFNYMAIGNSTNKKDAQSNAALDFCQFLIRTGHLNQNDLPKFAPSTNQDDSAGAASASGGSFNYNSLPKGLMAPHQSMGLNFNEEAQNSRRIFPYKRGPTAAYMEHINQMSSRRMLQDAEETDTNAEIHGNWTIETAKSRLHQYMQMNRINSEYKFSSTGADNNK